MAEDNQENNVEELKKILFRDDSLEKINLSELVNEYTEKLGYVDLQGNPIINRDVVSTLTRKDLIKAQIVGRVVASLIEGNIPEEIDIQEVIKWNVHDMPRDQVIARMNDLLREGFILRKKRGTYIGRLYQIKMWLKNLRLKNE